MIFLFSINIFLTETISLWIWIWAISIILGGFLRGKKGFYCSLFGGLFGFIIALFFIKINSLKINREPPIIIEPFELTATNGNQTFMEVVGESHYQRNIKKALGINGEEYYKSILFTIEPDNYNSYDDNAIVVKIKDFTVGYLPRNEAKKYRKMLATIGKIDKPAACYGELWGGGNKKSYGIWLDFSLNNTIKKYRRKEFGQFEDKN